MILTQPTVYAAVKNVIRTVFDTHDKFAYQGSFNSNDMPFDNTLCPEYIPEEYDLRSIYFGYDIDARLPEDEMLKIAESVK